MRLTGGSEGVLRGRSEPPNGFDCRSELRVGVVRLGKNVLHWPTSFRVGSEGFGGVPKLLFCWAQGDEPCDALIPFQNQKERRFQRSHCLSEDLPILTRIPKRDLVDF